jgi:hypothetical protein
MITREDAVAIARTRAQQQGWGLVEPLAVTQRRGWTGRLLRYEVVSNPAARGPKARFTIDASTGAILSEGYIPR